MRGQHAMVAGFGEVGDGTRAARGHFGHDGVGGVQHGSARGMHVLHDDPLDHGQVFHGADVAQPQVVAHADVGDDGHVAAVEGQAFAQDAAARRFEHRSVHVGMHEHAARAARAAAVAGVDAQVVHVDAVGIRHADAVAGRAQQVGGQAHRGGLAVGARHRQQAGTVLARLGQVGQRACKQFDFADHFDAAGLQRLDHLVAFILVHAGVFGALRDEQRRLDLVRMQRRRGGRQTVVVALRMAHHVLHLVQHGLPVRRNGLHEREQVRHAHVVHCGGIEVGRVGHAGQGGVAAVAGAVDADALGVGDAFLDQPLDAVCDVARP
ncbi:hypothetical protein G6F65_017137 [Rhizopus arrhizus]|nr:hypothetical protein G6F65_017137 [Rhizopus arrhizus]